jgi:hypothetical protein
MTHFLKGRKQSPEHIAKRTAAVRLAMNRPDVKAKMTGRPCSPETRAKIGAANSKSLRGRKLSHEQREKFKKARKEYWDSLISNPELMKARNDKVSRSLKGKYTGDKASNWKGGINQNQRTDNRIFSWKDAVIKRDDYTCQICLERGVFLHIDHIQPWADHIELRFEVSNGRALCRPCHYYVTFKRKMPKGSKWGTSEKVGIRDLS